MTNLDAFSSWTGNANIKLCQYHILQNNAEQQQQNKTEKSLPHTTDRSLALLQWYHNHHTGFVTITQCTVDRFWHMVIFLSAVFWQILHADTQCVLLSAHLVMLILPAVALRRWVALAHSACTDVASGHNLVSSQNKCIISLFSACCLPLGWQRLCLFASSVMD